jgi:hypothetical protein
MLYVRDRKIASHCPCGKDNHDGKFSPIEGYVDKGHCFSCGKNFTPNNLIHKDIRDIHFFKSIDKAVGYENGGKVRFSLPQKLVQEGMLYSESNVLLKYLSSMSNPLVLDDIRRLYQVGTAQWWPNSTIFWQIDVYGNVQRGKIIQYQLEEDSSYATGKNCKRVKSNKPPVKWVHKLPKVSYPAGKMCFFGEHLVPKFPDKKIGILESEKSALIASLYHPEYLWLASGGVSNINKENLQVLKSRDVHLFPDLKQLEVWQNIAAKFGELFRYKGCLKVVDTLEKSATESEKASGLDLADYLLREDWHTYNQRSG